MADPIDPPAEIRLLKCLPVIHRVAPKLPRPAKAIGRGTGNKQRLLILVQPKNLLIGPDIGAVKGNIDRDVADYLNASPVAMDLK